MKRSILLVNPNRMQPPIGPIGIDYLADGLFEAGHHVDILDLCFAPDYREAIRERLRAGQPDMIGFSIRNTDDCYFASGESFLGLYRDMLEAIREHTAAPVVLGGVGFSIMPQAILRRCGGDAGIVGDGERTLPMLVERLENKAAWREVPGLVWREGADWHANPPFEGPIDDGPRSRRLVENRRYLTTGGMGNVETKRGCAGHCIYCADPVSKGRRYRLRTPRAVVDELAILLAQGVDWLHVCDAEFNLPRDHAQAVCEEIIGRSLGDRLRWYTYAAAQPFDTALAILMRRAGCQGINFGVDSANDDVLRSLQRGYTKADVCATARSCKEAGLTFMFDLLLGGPGETEATAAETIAVVKELNPARIGAAVGLRVYPGTALARQVARDGFHSGNTELHGAVAGNEDCAEPVYYVSAGLGADPLAVVRRLVGDDERFFVGAKKDETERNYNYNDNAVLVDAISRGYRGAYWDILRKIRESK